jgi:hypothetical protein
MVAAARASNWTGDARRSCRDRKPQRHAVLRGPSQAAICQAAESRRQWGSHRR